MNSEKTLQKHKLKITPARLAVMDVFNNLQMPIDSQTLIAKIKQKGSSVDPATVFRMLNTFTKHGILRQIQFNEGKLRYERGDLEEHHHVICQNCGTIEDISDCNLKTLEKEIERKKKFKIVKHSLEFFGLCRNCA